jgi:site-specific recombinase XerC
VQEVEQQEITAAGAGNLSELLDRWLEYISPRRAAYTIYEYSRLIEKTIKPALGNVRVDRLTGRQLDTFYRKLEESGLSGSSIHQHHSVPSQTCSA